jgi:hypothetical protein
LLIDLLDNLDLLFNWRSCLNKKGQPL